MKKFKITVVHESGKKEEQTAYGYGVAKCAMKAQIVNDIKNSWYETNDRVKEIIFV